MKKAYIGIDSHKEQNVVAVAMAGRGEPELYWKARRASRRSRPAPARRICSRDPAPRRRRKRVPCSNGAAKWRPARPPSGGSCSELETGGVAVESPLQNLKRNHRFMEPTRFLGEIFRGGAGIGNPFSHGDAEGTENYRQESDPVRGLPDNTGQTWRLSIYETDPL